MQTPSLLWYIAPITPNSPHDFTSRLSLTFGPQRFMIGWANAVPGEGAPTGLGRAGDGLAACDGGRPSTTVGVWTDMRMKLLLPCSFECPHSSRRTIFLFEPAVDLLFVVMEPGELKRKQLERPCQGWGFALQLDISPSNPSANGLSSQRSRLHGRVVP